MKKYYILFTLMTLLIVGCFNSETDDVNTVAKNTSDININQAAKNNTNTEIEKQESNTMLEVEITDDELAYTNEDYGFIIKLSDNWKGYTATSRELDWGDAGISDSIDFNMKGMSLFNISMHTAQQWEALEQGMAPHGMYIGENKEYIFSYDKAQDPGKENINAFEDIDEIIVSFQLIK